MPCRPELMRLVLRLVLRVLRQVLRMVLHVLRRVLRGRRPGAVPRAHRNRRRRGASGGSCRYCSGQRQQGSRALAGRPKPLRAPALPEPATRVPLPLALRG